MPRSLIYPGMVEEAANAIRDHLRKRLNGLLDMIYADESPSDTEGTTINLQKIPDSRYYLTEGIYPLVPPACFIVADNTEYNLLGQNFLAQRHNMFVGILAEDLEIGRMQRKVWRYGKALWLALHDQNIGTVSVPGEIHVLVRSSDYGPVIQAVLEQSGQRSFHKDVVLRCEVLHDEPFPLSTG
jgi:hypothetical protein